MTKTSTFMPTVKERQRGEPCFVLIEPYDDFGLGDQQVMLNLREGTTIEDAQALARVLKDKVATVSLLR